MKTLAQLRRDAACVAMLILAPLATTAVFWSSSGSAAPPPIPTGASFNLAVARFRSAQAAGEATARIANLGMPAFTRTLSHGSSHQVVVGPYVSVEEADRAQRRLRRHGFGTTILVDESIRRVPRSTGATVADTGTAAAANLVIVGGAGRLALVIELKDEPRIVAAPPAGNSLVVVEAGPVSGDVLSMMWSGPDEANLIGAIAVEPFERGGARFLRASIALDAAAASRVRHEGHRVYVDLWEKSGAEFLRPRPAGPNDEVRTADSSADADEAAPAADEDERVLTIEEYRATVDPVITRLASIQPFIESALKAPSPEVLAALDSTITTIEEWVVSLEVPAEAATNHAALVSSIQETRQRLTASATSVPQPSTVPQP